MADPRNILALAADELETRGWRTEDYGTIDGCKCAWGAIHYATWRAHGHADEDLAEKAALYGGLDGFPVDEELLTTTQIQDALAAATLLADHLGLPSPLSRLADWNDRDAQDATVVVTAMRAAAQVSA